MLFLLEILIVENCFCYPGIFVIPDEVENCSFPLWKVPCCNFKETCNESEDCFGKMPIFTMLSIPILEYGRYFLSSEVYFDFYFQGFVFIFLQIVHLFDKDYTSYCVLFVAAVKFILSIMTFSVICTLLIWAYFIFCQFAEDFY